jgi:hypothetical protein
MKNRRLFKKITGLFMMVIFIITMASGIAADSISETRYDEDYEAYLQKVFERQAPALEAYSVLYTTFTVSCDGIITYPNDYAGAWIDDYKLHVAITTDKRASLRKYRDLLKDFDCVVYVTAEYSLNELDALRHSLFDEFGEELKIISHHVHESENKINFGFVEVDENKFIAALSRSNADRRTASGKPVTAELFTLASPAVISAESEPTRLGDVLDLDLFRETTILRVNSISGANMVISPPLEIEMGFLDYIIEVLGNNSDAILQYGEGSVDDRDAPEIWWGVWDRGSKIVQIRFSTASGYSRQVPSLQVGENENGDTLIYQFGQSPNWAVRLENNSDAYKIICAMTGPSETPPSAPDPSSDSNTEVAFDIVPVTILFAGLTGIAAIALRILCKRKPR